MRAHLSVASNLKVLPRAEMTPLDEEPVPSGMENAALEAEAKRPETGDASTPLVRSIPESGTFFTNEDNVTPNADEAAHDSNPELLPPSQLEEDPRPRPTHPRQPYEALTLIFGALVILAAAFFSFMIGSRIGWLRSAPAGVRSPRPLRKAAPTCTNRA